MLLAIDTSTQLAGIALYDGDVRGELTWIAGRSHSVQLMPQVEMLLRLLGLGVGDLKAVAAAQGPGSFTGLRVGLATAQGLALGLDVPLYGVPSLDVIAAGQEATSLPVRPLLDAGRRRFATALYRLREDRLEQVDDIVGIELGQLSELVQEPCLLCGDLTSETRKWVHDMLGERVRLASPALSLRRPGVLAQLAWAQHNLTPGARGTILEPVYLGSAPAPQKGAAGSAPMR